MGAAPQKSITENTGVALRGWDLFCSRRAALARLPTQGAAKLLAGLRSQPVECPEVRYRALQTLPRW